MHLLKTRLRIKRIHVLLVLLALSVCFFYLKDRRRHTASSITAAVPAETDGTVKDIGLAIVAAARTQVGKTVKYDPAYVRLKYPMGDIPIETGVCTDVVIRALRDALGMDLQQLVHEDMDTALLLYPKAKGIRFPDKSIDHRRVLNLMKYFERKGFAVPVSDNPEDYLPGDVIANDVHIMIVSDRKTEQGFPLIIHNIGGGAREEEFFSLSTLSGHYRINRIIAMGKPMFICSFCEILWRVLAGVTVIGVIIGTTAARRYFRK